MKHRLLWGALIIASGALPVRASGLAIPDLGTASMGQGCSTIAAPDDFAAFYYNPAGLAQQGGLRLEFDSRATLHRVTFQRLNADGTNPQGFVSVSNSGGVSITSMAPLGGASWRWDKGPVPLTFALGGWPYSGATGYGYPDPVAIRATGVPEAQVKQSTPQRYASIYSGSKIYTAAAGVAAHLTDWLDVGGTLQFVTANFISRVAVASGVVSNEDTAFDADLTINGQTWFRPTGSLGASFHLPYGLHVGGSFQFGTKIVAPGTLEADLTPTLEALNTKLIGNQIDVSLNLPWTARLGVRLIRTAWELELSGTLDGWHVLDQITITPHDITVQVAGNQTPLPELYLPKHLKNAGSVRLGGLYRLGDLHPSLFNFVARAGALYETSAVTEEHQSLDEMNWARGAVSLGLGVKLGALSIETSYMHYFQPDLQVRNSQVTQVVALPGKAASVIGNGDYGSNIDLISLSLSYRFD